MDHYNKNRMEAIKVVEALRTGVPTRISTRTLPDLRKNLTETLRADLDLLTTGKIPRGRLIWGQYGQGKTHVLTTTEHLALDRQFAVSFVSLSREVSCHNLFHFYGRAASRLRTPDSSMFGLERALSKKHASDLQKTSILVPDRYIHPLPAIVIENYLHSAGEEQNLLYGDLMGTRIPLTELKRIHRQNYSEKFPTFETSFRMVDHAKAYFGCLADTIVFCGYRGWVILIDELELVGRLGSQSRLKAYQNLQWLLNWSKTHHYPIYVIAAAATSLQSEMWYGGKDDRTLMPKLAEEKFGKSAYNEITEFFEYALSPQSLVVTPASEEAISELLKRIVELHGKAYSWEAKLDVNSLVRNLGETTLRTYIRATLESLDHQFLYHETIQTTPFNFKEKPLTEDDSFFSNPYSQENNTENNN